MADRDTALREVAELVSAVLRYAPAALEAEIYPVAFRFGTEALAGPEATEKALRKALGIPGPRSVTYDMADNDSYNVLTAGQEMIAADQRHRARTEGGNPRRHQWADQADAMMHQANVARAARDDG